MNNQGPDFEIPKKIEHYLAALSKLYTNNNEDKLLEIIVNAQIRVCEAWTSYDDFNDGSHFGHAVYLSIPEALYLTVINHRNKIELRIKDDINKLHNLPDEYIEKIFLEMKFVEDKDWRKESGLLLSGKRTILPDVADRIWGDTGYKVFLCHKTEVKKEVALLKRALENYGISCFVAHEDIHPTKEWQAEIENALDSMDSLVALLTEDFHDSLWTDQEVGFAFGRGVPIISVKLGKDPYGFIGKFQALLCSWENAAKEIVKILIKYEGMVSAFIIALKNCTNYDMSNSLAEILPSINKLSTQQTKNLIDIYNTNEQISESFGFNGKKPHLFGEGLLYHLNRITGENYKLSKSGKIK